MTGAPSRVGLGAGLACAALAACTSATAAVEPSPGSARLAGRFLLAGRVTVADDVPGERAGQILKRTWTFTSPCAKGPCPSVILVRERATGTDRLVLRRRAPGYYVGSGRFYAPLRCGTRVYPKGAQVPFAIAVRVTSATLLDNVVLASRVRATYTNPERTNLTPCVTALGHDAARYHGHIVTGA